MTRECSNRRNVFKLAYNRFRLDIGKKLFCGKALARVAQKSCGRPIPGRAQGQIGCGLEKFDPVEHVPVDGRGVADGL